MSRKHLFAVVVLLGAAAVAGLLALTRTTTAATHASNTQITAKTRSLDQLEASLRRSLAEHPPTLDTAPQGGDTSASRTVLVGSSAAVEAPTGQREGDHDQDGHEYEDDHEYEGGDD